MASVKQKVAKGAFWVLLERFSTEGVHFIVTLILARLLTPTDYGTVALLSIFLALSSVLAVSGFGQALIQKKDANDLDFNSVFYLSLALSGTLYLLLFALAPWVASFYDVPVLKPMLRVMAVTVIFNAINSVQDAELSRKMLFHLSFRISVLSTVASAIVGISMAYGGCGVWALVGSSVTAGVVGVVSRWVIIAWRPRLMFSFKALRPLFKYSWKLVVSSLLESGYNNLYSMLIGKWYSRADLAFVEKGRQLPAILMSNVNSALGRATFPALSQMQDDKAKLREAMRRMIRASTFLVFPLMTVFAFTASPTIKLLYGDQWDGAVIYAQIACFSFALWPFHTINLNAIKSMGRSDLFLTLEIIKKVWGLAVLAFCLPRGVVFLVAVGAFISGPFGVIVNSWPNRKLLGYTILMQLKDVYPSLLMSGAAWMVMWIIGRVPLHYLALMAIQALAGFGVYFLLAWMTRSEPFYEYVTIAQRLVKRK